MWYFSGTFHIKKGSKDIFHQCRSLSISVLYIFAVYTLFFVSFLFSFFPFSFFVSLCVPPPLRLQLLFISMSRWGRNRQRQVISDGLMVMTVASQAEWMGLIELCVYVCACMCVCDYTCVGGSLFCKWQAFPWQQLRAGRFQVKVN